MPTPDDDARRINEVRLTNERGRWRVHIRYADEQRIWSASNLEKALSSPDKRARRETPDGVL